VKLLKYFADLHLNSFFHGNIKPDKIFVSNREIYVDPGNTLLMNEKDEDDEIYINYKFSLGFASQA
jgi:hypothetical protein